MEFKDYYATLGVARTATEKEVKQAYRKLARKLHPDVNPGDASAERRFKEINEAYEVIGNPERRKKYDELGANWRAYEQAPGGAGARPGGQGWRVDLGGPGDFRTVSEDELGDMLGGGAFSEFFQAFFGGAPSQSRGPARSRRRAGRDVEQELQLVLEEAYRGTLRRLSIKSDGHTRTVDVRIPPGVKDGARVRVPGEGESGLDGGTAGDLYLRIRLLPHERFERRGDDLHVRVSVPITTAALGGQADVPTLEGKPVRLKIPELTQSGQVFRIRNKGMPVMKKAGEHGDLYVAIDIEMPTSLSPEQRAHYEALARLDR